MNPHVPVAMIAGLHAPSWRRLVFVIIVVMVGLSPSLYASRGAWLRAQGGYYGKVALLWLTAEQEFDLEGNRRGVFSDTLTFSDGQFGMTDIILYGELGITDWLTGVASTNYLVAVREARFRHSGRDTTLSSSGLGDVWLGARFQVLDSTWPVLATTTLSMKVPTGSPSQSIPLGTGVVDYELSVAVARGFTILDAMEGYGQLSGGFRLRNAASNEFNYAVETGINVTKFLMAQLTFDGVISTADFTSGAVTHSVVRALVNEQSYARWNLAVIYNSSPTLDLLAAYNKHIAGRNSLAGSSFSIGIAWKR
jgi:hypothetical protein